MWVLRRASPHRGAIVALPAALALLAGGCGQADTPAAAPKASSTSSPAAEGYLAPPELVAAERTGQGLTLSGRAAPGAAVLMASPEGERLMATAAGDGAWSLSLAQRDGPALFALSAQIGDRVVRGEGPVVVLPQPGPPALLARAGFAALPIEAASTAPRIVALDYDAGGGAGMAGVAAPQAQIRISIDGAPAGVGRADARGRFAVLASNRPLARGLRRLAVETDSGRAEVLVQVEPPPPLGSAVYRAVRQQGAWRIDWAPAGGGVQTTVVFDRNPETLS